MVTVTHTNPNGGVEGRITEINGVWYQKLDDPLSSVLEEDLKFYKKSHSFESNGESVIALEKDWDAIRKASSFEDMYG